MKQCSMHQLVGEGGGYAQFCSDLFEAESMHAVQEEGAAGAFWQGVQARLDSF